MNDFIEAMFEELRDWLRQAGRHILAWMDFRAELERRIKTEKSMSVQARPIKPDKPDKAGMLLSKALPVICAGAALLDQVKPSLPKPHM